jgi:hypothetical protein
MASLMALETTNSVITRRKRPPPAASSPHAYSSVSKLVDIWLESELCAAML